MMWIRSSSRVRVATPLVFITDPGERQPTVQFPGLDKWDTIGGPSLCIYNDRPFTKADIKGIEDLGKGSKRKDPLKTGQYGVGFNSVYHFTDTPVFMSEGPEIGQVLCASDPHYMYVPGATAEDPGIKINNPEAACPGILDVFLVNKVKEFPLKNSTMFRFPLRTESQARVSEISHNAVTVDEMKKILMNLKKDIVECLPFLNDVSVIEIGHMNAEGIYEESYHAELSKDENDKQQEFMNYVEESTLSLKNRETGIESVGRHTVQYVGNFTDSEGRKEKWLIEQVFGFSSAQQVHPSVREAYSKGELGLLPRAGVAMMLDCKDASLQERYREKHCLYCFLPLPVQINLPMHVNGHFVLNGANRRGLWHDDNDTGFRTNWNYLLLQDLIAPAYVRLMMCARDNILQTGKEEAILRQIETYYQLFPRPESFCSKYLSLLCDSVFELLMKEECLPVHFPEQNDQISVVWYKPNECYIGYLGSTGQIDLNTEKYKGLTKTLLQCQFPFLQGVPEHIHERLIKMKNIYHVNPAEVVKFLCTFRQRSPKLKKLWEAISKQGPIQVSDTVFQSVENIKCLYWYIMETNSGESKRNFVSRLDGLPLLLTASKQITTFSSTDKKILSDFSDLAVGASDQFVHPFLVESLTHYPNVSKLRLHANVFSDLTVEKLANILNQSTLKSLAINECCEMKELMKMHPKEEGGGKDWLVNMWKFLAKCAQDKRKQLRSGQLGRNDYQIEREAFLSVSPLHCWCLVPVQNKDGKESLIRLNAVTSVFDEYRQRSAFHTYEAAIHAALKRLGLPQPLYTVLQGTPSGAQLMSKWVTSLDKPDGVLSALSKQFDKCGNVNETLTTEEHEEVKAVMEYFSYNLEAIKGVSCAVSTLQKLPGYRTVSGTTVNLDSSQAYILPRGIPTIKMQAWVGEGNIFLQHVEDLKMRKLLEYVDCKILTVTEVYCEFVFPHFGLLSEKAQDTHINYVRGLMNESRNYTYPARSVLGYGTDERSTLIQAIKDLAFIQDSEGNTKTVRHFFDPREDVFVQFKEPSELLPERYRSKQWYPFLEECGLKHNVTEEMFLEFARSLEGEEIDENFHRKSQALLDCLNTMYRNDCISLQEIKFLAPHKVGHEYLAIHPQFSQNPICFKDSVRPGAEELAWSNCDIMPESAKRFVEMSMERLGSVAYPAIKMVIKHIENISERLSALSTQDFQQHARAMEKISEKFLLNLDMKRAKVRPEQVQSLSGLKFVVHTEGTVSPNQLVLSQSSDDELYPYIVKCPPYLIRDEKLVELLKLLGMQGTQTLDQLARVLKKIHESSDGKELNPNEHEAAEKATARFLCLLEKESTFDTAELYFLCGDRTMQPAKEVIIIDNDRLFERIGSRSRSKYHFLLRKGEFIERINDFQARRAVQRLPEKLRPSLLTEIFSEHVNQEAKKVTENSEFAKELRDRFCDPAFTSSISRLLKYASYSKTTNDGDTQIGDEEIQSRLMAVKVFSPHSLETYLMDAENEKIEDSSDYPDYFIEDNPLTIFVTPDTLQELFYRDLARSINLLFDGVLHGDSLLCLTPILRTKLSDLHTLLTRMEIPVGGGPGETRTSSQGDGYVEPKASTQEDGSGKRKASTQEGRSAKRNTSSWKHGTGVVHPNPHLVESRRYLQQAAEMMA